MSDELSRLTLALSDQRAASRREAAAQLARLGENARAAAVPLVRLCGDEDEETRQWAAAALEELGAPSPGDAEALTALLPHEQEDVGYWAATLLGRLGAEGAPGVEGLATALRQSPHAIVRQRAAWALGRIGPAAEGAREALRQAAQSDDPRLARLSQQALEKIRT